MGLLEAETETETVADVRDRFGLTITEAAEAVGLSASTLRLWEQHDLVTPRRTTGGSRRYDETHLALLRRIIDMRSRQKLQPRAIAHLLAQERKPNAPESNDQERESIGRRLRRFRQQRGMTLKEASEAVDRSVSWLSAVETGASGISMASLQHLTVLYGSNFAELIDSDGAPLARVVKADARKRVSFGANSGMTVSQLTPGGDKLGAQLYVLEPGEGSREPYSHEGDELAFILSGTLEIHLASSETYVLNTGDCISFPSTIPHRWHNPGDTQTSVFWVNSPVTF